MVDIDQRGLEAAVRECARITAPEVTDEEFERERVEGSSRYLKTREEMSRAIGAYLSAQQREPVVRVKDILDCSVRLDGCSSNEPTIREMVEKYYLTGIPHEAEYARSCAARFIAAIEIQSSDGGVEGHAGDAKQATGAAVTGAPPTSGDTISPTDLLAAGVESGPSEAIADVSVDELARLIERAVIDDCKTKPGSAWFDGLAAAARALLSRHRIGVR